MSETRKQLEDQASRKPFRSEEEARAVPPSNAKRFKLWMVSDPSGQRYWTWAESYRSAIVGVANGLGWKSYRVDKPVTKEDVGSMLARLSPEDRALLIQQYVPTETEKGPGKGKR